MDNQSEHNLSDLLLAKYISGEASADELLQVDNWRKISEENENYFQELNLVWFDTGIINTESNEPKNINVDGAWNKMQKRVQSSTKVIPKQSPSINWKYALRIAAVVLVVIGGTWLFRQDNNSVIEKQLLASNEIVNYSLSDSSKIVLNKNSQLTYPEKFNENERRVKLKGEAHFKIEPNKEKPFVIEVNKAIVKVLGTSFVVKEEGDSAIRVGVESGKVQFGYEDEQVILTKGMSAVLDLRTGEITQDEEAKVNLGSWKSKKLSFRSTQLSEVVESLNELYPQEIVIQNKAINDCLLSATFDNEDLEVVLMIIESTFGFEIERTNNVIIIKGDGC